MSHTYCPHTCVAPLSTFLNLCGTSHIPTCTLPDWASLPPHPSHPHAPFSVVPHFLLCLAASTFLSASLVPFLAWFCLWKAGRKVPHLMTMGSGTSGIVITKQCLCTLQPPHCLMLEILVRTAIVSRRLSVLMGFHHTFFKKPLIGNCFVATLLRTGNSSPNWHCTLRTMCIKWFPSALSSGSLG